MSSMYRFQMSGLLGFWLMISVSSSAIKMLAKDTTIFVPIAVPFFPLKWKESSFKSWHFSEEVSWNRKLLSIECFVCSTYNFDSFPLRDISVKASNVH